MNPKKLGFRTVKVHFGMFDFELECLVGPPDNLVKYIRWAMDDPDFDWSAYRKTGGFFMCRGKSPRIWLPRVPRTPKEYGSLAHEVSHAIRHMLGDWAGLPHSFDSDEAYAHATGFAVRSILEGLKRS